MLQGKWTGSGRGSNAEAKNKAAGPDESLYEAVNLVRHHMVIVNIFNKIPGYRIYLQKSGY